MTTLLTPVDDATRRQFLTILSASALLSACGAGDGETSTTSASTGTATWSRGPFGPVEVPRAPERVVACNGVDADFALALGLRLVGAPGAIGQPGAPFAAYHADQLAGVSRSETGAEPNVEQVATLSPDLILDSWDTERARYDDWTALAPTVNFAPVLYPDDFARTDWQAAVRELGALFAREGEASRAVTAYEQAVREARRRLDLPSGTTFAAVNGYPGEGVGVIDAGQQVSKVAVDLGLTPSSLVSADPASRVVLSFEELGRLEAADVLLVAVYPAEGSLDRDLAALDPVFDSPLWRLLPAVRAGRVVQYPGELYYASPLTAPLMVAALVEGLA